MKGPVFKVRRKVSLPVQVPGKTSCIGVSYGTTAFTHSVRGTEFLFQSTRSNHQKSEIPKNLQDSESV